MLSALCSTMGFPQSFIDDLRLQADILQVVQEYVSLRKSGATYKGLCPFHSEKSPSFHVNRDKGFFHCFGCGVGGDVFKFLELQEKLGFVDAVKHLASKFGMPLPEEVGGRDAHADAAEREALLKAHERAAEYFQAQLSAPAGRKAQRMLHDRGITTETIKRLGIGYAPPAYEGLKAALVKEGLPLPLLVRSGLAVERDNGQTVDRFRGRLMIPIARDAGSIVAFGGRAMEKDQQPKYLNSPETSIYTKSRDAVRPQSDQRRHPPARLRRLGRRVFRFRPAGAGGHRAGRRLVRHGPDAGSGPTAAALHVEGHFEFRS